MGVLVVSVSGFMGIENVLAPGTLNISIMVFSVLGILAGSIMLWLGARKSENT